ncbi:MAG: glycosyltransferase [Flavobacteriales bacterium]
MENENDQSILSTLASNSFHDDALYNQKAEILLISSYPSRVCGIATYSQDLLNALSNKFSKSFTVKVCALETGDNHEKYGDEVKYVLNTADEAAYTTTAQLINMDRKIEIVLIQHEFGLFDKMEYQFQQFIDLLSKHVIVAFHTVLPHPHQKLKAQVQSIANASDYIVVMTNYSSSVLKEQYNVPGEKIVVIPHGTHLVPHTDKALLKEKYHFEGRRVLSTFGLLSSGKSIETTIDALPAIVKSNQDVLFLIIGKTHPTVVVNEGQRYREMLEMKVEALGLKNHVLFINRFLPVDELLEHLQLTDIYLFTSKDPNQAVSGTFSYAISCGCPVVSTPIPHAREVLQGDAGIIIDFENSEQLSSAVINLLDNEELRTNISMNGLHRMASTAWENSAIQHAVLFANTSQALSSIQFDWPSIHLEHVKSMTTDFGMIQFSIINKPDIESGYTLDDNARALIAMCMHYELTSSYEALRLIQVYVQFIKHCLQPKGYFLNYVDSAKTFTDQNNNANLADANGRAIWALGFLLSKRDQLPEELIAEAQKLLLSALPGLRTLHSTRAMAFAIKGLYYFHTMYPSVENESIIVALADRLVQMYRHESERDWRWYESYLTYGNSILPEAMLCAWQATGNIIYKDIAKTSFDFLLQLTFDEGRMKLISNKSWLRKGHKAAQHGEQPIDVAYTILALSRFNDVFEEADYPLKMNIAFNWFLGNNHLNQIIYNPCTGGCYDGLEEHNVNLNQGAESTLSYLISRLAMELLFSPTALSSSAVLHIVH